MWETLEDRKDAAVAGGEMLKLSPQQRMPSLKKKKKKSMIHSNRCFKTSSLC